MFRLLNLVYFFSKEYRHLTFQQIMCKKIRSNPVCFSIVAICSQILDCKSRSWCSKVPYAHTDMKGRLTKLHITPVSNGGSEDKVQTQCGKDKLKTFSCKRTHYSENLLIKDKGVLLF